MFVRTPRKSLLLLSLAISSIIPNLGMPIPEESQCQTCLDLWRELVEIEDFKECKQYCRSEAGSVLDPPCEKSCCRKLCSPDEERNAFRHCRQMGYCKKREAPTETPTATPTRAPFAIPEECALAVSCYDCVSRGCYFRLGGGNNGCSDCLPRRGECGTETGAYCDDFSQNSVGRDNCVAQIEADCGDYL